MYPFKDQLEKDIAGLKDAGTYKDIGIVEGFQGPEIKVAGKTVLNFCANNYLGLAGSEMLRKAAHDSLDKYGFGMASVSFIVGTSTVHKELEAEIATFFGTDDAILYGSCFDANTGLFETILAEGDAVFSDELNHASIIDGIRLCKAERFRYKHSDLTELESQLKTAGERRRKLIATDRVFSMDGDTAKLDEICALAKKYNALVMVDDSHASGVLEAMPAGQVDIITSTFGKALGGASGGFTTGRKEIIDYLRQRSRPSLFSNSLAPVIAGVALFVLKNFNTTMKEARATLTSNTQYFRGAMTKLGFKLGGDGSHPITPVMLMDEKLSAQFAGKLLNEGVYVRSFSYPVVPQGKARIRVQLSAAHTKDHMDKAIAAFAKIGKELNVI